MKTPRIFNLGVLIAFALALAACGGGEKNQTSTGDEQWSCSMHPQIILPDPGDCPICKMDLIPLSSMQSAAGGERDYSMSESAKALARIQTSEVTRGAPMVEVRLFGKIAYDETRVRTLSARFPARIDRLFVDYTGIGVQPGDHLAKIYSPELLAAQSELLSSIKFDNPNAIAAARDKLRLWNLSAEQIAALESSGKTSDHVDIDAPIGGIVTHKNISEGDYVTEGMRLFQISDLSQVWAVFDAYESDLAWLRFGQDVEFTTDATAGETFSGKISFISPQLDPKTRTAQVRINAPNPAGHLKPAVLARAIVKATLGKGAQVIAPDLAGKWISPMHPEIIKDEPGECDICGMKLLPAEELGYAGTPAEGELPLLIPASAVLHTGKRSVVYVEKPDNAEPTYEGREVVLGPRAGDQYVVTRGLSAGERVVTRGAMKIDSALQILAKPSMMSPRPGHIPTPPGFRDALAVSLTDYYTIQAALADDKLAPAKLAAAKLLESQESLAAIELPSDVGAVWAPYGKVMLDSARTISIASELPVARTAFERLSDHVIAALEKFGVPEQIGAAYVMFCPMAFETPDGDRGARWLQPHDKIRNPYQGHLMLECGTQKGKLGTASGEPPAPSRKAHQGHDHGQH